MDVLKPRARPAPHFYGTAIALVNNAVRDGDIFRLAAAKAKNRPPGAERAICHHHEFATAEQSARVVLRLDIAVGHIDVLAADEMESVVIVDDAAMNMDAVQLNIPGLDDAHRMKRAVFQKNVAHGQVVAAMKKQVIRPPGAADPGR